MGLRKEKNEAAEARRVETERNLEKGTAAEMKREEENVEFR